jgi:hypothetical protein
VRGVPSSAPIVWDENTIAITSGAVNTLTTANSYCRILKFTGTLTGTGTIIELLDYTTDWILDFTAVIFTDWLITVEMGLAGKTFTVNTQNPYYVFAKATGSGYLYYVQLT